MKHLMMILVAAFSASLVAYVPTVEGLFRHGNNPDVTTNALLVTASITPHNPFDEKTQAPANPIWIKWIYNVTPQGKLKLSQLIYSSAAMTDANLIDKVYVAELSPKSFGPAHTERGLLLALMNSIVINDGSFMIDFLQSHGVSVSANTEILNQDKMALLARYRGWLAQNKGGRATGGDESPLSPSSPTERERVNRLMSSAMYLDSEKVSLSRYQGDPAWLIKTENFEAFIDDAKREIRQVLLRQSNGEIDITCHDPMLLNGSHRMPKQIIIKNTLDQHYQISFISLRHFNESPSELVTRLRRYDQVLSTKRVAIERPSFLY